MTEKKSTTRKLKPDIWSQLPKKVEEEAEPTNETQRIPASASGRDDVQQTPGQVKPQEINWDVIGISSAAVTLLGASLLFMIGWSYESNWYLYFGINTSQVNIPLPQVLIRSVPIIFLAFLTIFFSFIVVNVIMIIQKDFEIRAISLEELESPEGKLLESPVGKLRKFFRNIRINLLKFSSVKQIPLGSKWWVIFCLSLLIILSGSFYYFPFSVAGNYFEYVGQLPFEAISVIPIGALVIAVVLLMPQFLFSLKFREIFLSYLFAGINQTIWKAIFGILYLFAILFMSASVAFSNAAAGRKGISPIGNIQKVFLVSPELLSFMNDVDLSFCGTNNAYFYGPFGLVEENDNSFFLIKSGVSQTGFSRDPWLYILPRNDPSGSYAIVPASISIPSSVPTCATVTNTATPLPIPMTTVTLEVAFTATLTAQPATGIASTPTQP